MTKPSVAAQPVEDDGGMTRLMERLIDLVATISLLAFAWLFRQDQPAMAGMVAYASVQFWLRKNAAPADDHPASIGQVRDMAHTLDATRSPQ